MSIDQVMLRIFQAFCTICRFQSLLLKIQVGFLESVMVSFSLKSNCWILLGNHGGNNTDNLSLPDPHELLVLRGSLVSLCYTNSKEDIIITSLLPLFWLLRAGLKHGVSQVEDMSSDIRRVLEEERTPRIRERGSSHLEL